MRAKEKLKEMNSNALNVDPDLVVAVVEEADEVEVGLLVDSTDAVEAVEEDPMAVGVETAKMEKAARKTRGLMKVLHKAS